MRKLFIAALCVLCHASMLTATIQLFSSSVFAQQKSASLRGRVVDAQTGEPVAKVRINIVGSDRSATTDDNGAFVFQDLQPGEIILYITTIGYGLVKRTVIVKDSDTETEIALNQETSPLTEQVTITAEPFEPIETNAASQQILNKTELQDLSKVLIGDPIRAAQSLPGITANNDLRSDFSVRGADFRRTGIYVDDILTDSFLHLVPGNQIEKITISVVNTDTINSVSLLSGAFPAKYGDSTAAVLNLQTRDGNRVKPAYRIATGLQLGTSGIVDGPFRNKKGSWLVSARSSLLDYVARVVESIDTDEEKSSASADFSDVQGKVVYDTSSRHQLGVSTIFGLFLFDENEQIDDPNFALKGHSRNFNINAFWKYTPGPHLLAQTRVFGLRTSFGNTNTDSVDLEDKLRTQLGVRSDINILAHRRHRIEAGLYLRSMHGENVNNFFDLSNPAQPLRFGSFDRRATEQGYYAQDTLSLERLGLTLTGGVRIDHSGLVNETVASPRASFSMTPAKHWTIRAGAGNYYQVPEFDPLFGPLGNSNLRPERATHYNLSVERTFGERTRILAEAYDREDSDLLFSLSEPRLEAGSIVFTEFPFRNALRGHARGIELTLQRRSANRLTGWVSYAYSRTHLRDEQNNLSFVSDFDQRHTLSTHASYRFTGTFNVSGQWRYGSGQPIVGFFQGNREALDIASERNRIRFPAYSRVDIRANKAFLFKKSKLTLSGEILNLLNRENIGFLNLNVDRQGRRIFGSFAPSFPILPSVGIAIEF